MDNIQKIQALKDILKNLNVKYYNELSQFVLKLHNGEYDNLKDMEIDNKKLVDSLDDIDETKASKILSNLNKIGIVRSSIERNKYKIIPKEECQHILYNIINTYNNTNCENLNKIYSDPIHSTLYKKINPYKRFNIMNELVESIELNTNIYQESLIFEFLSVPESRGTIIRKIFGKYFTDELFDKFKERGEKFKQRLTKIIDNGIKGGKHRFIYCFGAPINYYLNNPEFNNISLTEKKDTLIQILRILKEGLVGIKEFILKNKLFILFEFKRKQFLGSTFIFSPHIFKEYNLDPSSPYKISVLYYYNKQLAEYMGEIFEKMFISNLKSLKSHYDIYAGTIYKIVLGKNLYKKAIKTIDDEIEEIEDL
ncbi:MAG: hypothetical protein EU549_03195 [Promethearchaeota archaeon]|nr:MAG: hypothetical protein EU549_03195 [Candidatus Lokiarchaeota archaeon]